MDICTGGPSVDAWLAATTWLEDVDAGDTVVCVPWLYRDAGLSQGLAFPICPARDRSAQSLRSISPRVRSDSLVRCRAVSAQPPDLPWNEPVRDRTLSARSQGHGSGAERPHRMDLCAVAHFALRWRRLCEQIAKTEVLYRPAALEAAGHLVERFAWALEARNARRKTGHAI